MGAKTGLLAYADGPAADLLQGVTRPDLERTDALVRRLYPTGEPEKVGGSNLSEGCYPPDHVTYAGSFPGIDVLCDQRFMIDRPSQLPEHLIEEGRGRRIILHAMHSVVDWLAFAVWEDNRLIRSLSVAPDGGVIEDIGARLPFEMPYWAGEHPVTPVPGWPDQEPYPLPFHPLDLGEDALRALFGFILEGRRSPSDVDADSILLEGYRTHDPGDEERDARYAEARKAMKGMKPRRFTFGPDGTLVEITP